MTAVVGPIRPAAVADDLSEAIVAARSGDEVAFGELWRAYTPALRRFLVVLVPGWVDDLVSETWHDVIRDLHRFSGDQQGFRAWLFTVARHRALDWRRRESVRPADPVPVEHMLHYRAPDDPAADALAALATERALRLVRLLPPDQAEIVCLRVLADLDVAHVASVTGRRPGTVRVLAHRGLHRLAELIGEDGELR